MWGASCFPDFPQQPDCKKEDLLAQPQLWNQVRNFVLDQEEPEPPQVEEEQEELFIGQEGELLIVKVEADTFTVTPISEENQQIEAEPNGEQLLSHNSAITEIQDEEGRWHLDAVLTKEEPKPKKRQWKTRSPSNSDDDSLTSQTVCEYERDDQSALQILLSAHSHTHPHTDGGMLPNMALPDPPGAIGVKCLAQGHNGRVPGESGIRTANHVVIGQPALLPEPLLPQEEQCGFLNHLRH
ncbi:uncharacterized protein KZ484_011251 isoform 4-T5 [Pholidichthys leucotaenia]